MKIGVALVGPGRIATAHVASISKAADIAQLTAVVGLPAEDARTAELARKFGAMRATSDLDGVLADPLTHAIVLSVPNHLHCRIAIQALSAGKHVLVEKPLATSLSDSDLMIAAARKFQRVLMVGQCRRFFPALEQARELLPSLGRPLDIVHILGLPIETAPTDWWSSTDAAGGGPVLWVNGPHFVDTVLWFMGEAPVDIYARGATYNAKQWRGADQMTAVMSFSDGSVASGHLSFNMRPAANDQWIVGPKGTLRILNDRSLFVNGELLTESEPEEYLQGDISFERQFRAFAESVLGKKPPLITAEENRVTIEAMEKIEAKYRQNQIRSGGHV
ncbi:Gfo/Idh/MocA family oxidoreductase [Mesorhizobium sp.]|uniref:Gfo/Idh/MocA family protein n=1 Tax=Mesorhizobium sp. TaxID=1871066 RepID=UPI0025EB0134|nr:Gfo/Idh/MocA family oxidoreductase [Mesorhizobium sp.]